MWRLVIGIAFTLGSLAASAATCTWNAASGNWSVVANWSNCADAPGPSTRTPGAADVAVVANGTANPDAARWVAEFELGNAGIVAVVGPTKTFDVANALRFAGGKATTILGTNQLLLKLHAGGSGSLSAATTLENAVFFENSGTLTLGSASGVALTLLCCAELRNMPGGSMAFSGGDSKLYLDNSSQLINNAGATLTINGNMTVTRATATAALSTLLNLGTMQVNGPGTLTMALGTGFLKQFGDLTVNNATILCSNAAATTLKCAWRETDNLNIPTNSITRLDNATIDIGGTGVNDNLPYGSTLTGSGTFNGDLSLYGKLAPGALSATPYRHARHRRQADDPARQPHRDRPRRRGRRQPRRDRGRRAGHGRQRRGAGRLRSPRAAPGRRLQPGARRQRVGDDVCQRRRGRGAQPHRCELRARLRRALRRPR